MKRVLLSVCFICCASLCAAENARPRYISLAPSTTEILFALGLDEEIVAVTSFCDYPEAARSRVRVGDFSHPSIETILSLRPDHVFCTGLEQEAAILQLKRLNLNVYVADPSSIEELFTSIEDIGLITHKTQEAAALIKKMRDDIAAVRSQAQRIPEKNKVRVFIEIWHRPLMTAGRGSFVDELVTLAGGINVAHDMVRPYCHFSAEKVVALDPDCIIMAYMDKEPPLKLVAGRYGWKNIKAVKNKQVFNDISPDILLRPGPRITEGLKEIHKRLYPQKDAGSH